MTVEATIFNALKGLVNNRVYPDVAPANTARPYITYQQVGGLPVNFVEGGTPSKANGRFQVSVWADTRATASATAKLATAALRATASLQTTVLSEPVATHDGPTGYRGTRQDFSFWFDS